MTTKAVFASSEDVGLWQHVCQLTFKSLGNFSGLTAEFFLFFFFCISMSETEKACIIVIAGIMSLFNIISC